jgi:hypothetical protein
LTITTTIGFLVDIINIEFSKSIMATQIQLLPSALSELFVQATTSGCITLADRYGLMAAILDGSLHEDEHRMIDRLLRAVIKGRVKIVDEISMLS